METFYRHPITFRYHKSINTGFKTKLMIFNDNTNHSVNSLGENFTFGFDNATWDLQHLYSTSLLKLGARLFCTRRSASITWAFCGRNHESKTNSRVNTFCIESSRLWCFLSWSEPSFQNRQWYFMEPNCEAMRYFGLGTHSLWSRY